jgi:spectinomycin phosphotransferase
VEVIGAGRYLRRRALWTKGKVRIRDRLEARAGDGFGLKVNTIEGNDAGVDRSAQRFRVHADDPRTGPGWYAVKWSTGGSTAGLLVPSALAAASVAGVPGPRLARDGRPWAD